MWHRCGVEASAALMKALGSRGLRVETSGSGHEVLAMGCAEQQKGRGLIVVLDGGGDGLDSQDRVIEGMERFCPSGLVWVYEEEANPPLRGFVGTGGRLRAVVRDVPERKGNGIVGGSGGGSVGGPVLRLSGMNGGVKNGSGLTASDVLDRDELAALLKPDE